MSGRNLTKQQALKLITPVVDNEVDEELRTAFFAFIDQNNEVRNKFESEKRLKEVVSERCPYAKAPDRLHQRIREFLADPDKKSWSEPALDEPFLDKPSVLSEAAEQAVPSSITHSTSTSRTAWKYAAAAAVLIATVLAAFYYSPLNSAGTFNLEENVYAHFVEHGGQMVEPTIASASLGAAETQLAEVFNTPVSIPTLKNAEFVGVVFTDFIPDFKAPMLEYHLPSENQYIYIFAFSVKDLERFEKLVRSRDAIQTCKNSKDYHVRNVNGKHVVSWKWGDTWYSAISNHDGRTLASLVGTLQNENGFNE